MRKEYLKMVKKYKQSEKKKEQAGGDLEEYLDEGHRRPRQNSVNQRNDKLQKLEMQNQVREK